MLGLMTVAAHEAALKLRDEKHEASLQTERDIGQRALDAERSITKSLKAEIEAMKPLVELGKARQAGYERDSATRKARREAAKATAPVTVPAVAKPVRKRAAK